MAKLLANQKELLENANEFKKMHMNMIQEILISIIRLGGLINDVNFIHIEDFSAKIITSKCNSIDELKSEYLKANKSIDDFIKTNYNKDLKAIEKINNLLNSGNIEFSNNESFSIFEFVSFI